MQAGRAWLAKVAPNKKWVSQRGKQVQMCYELGMKVDLSFMMLLPGESPENLDATLSLVEELDNYPNIKIDGPKCYNPYPGTEFFDQVVANGWKIPKSNEEWAKYNRSISLTETGFNISEGHLKILHKHKIL